MPFVVVKHESNIARYLREKSLNLKTSAPAVLHQAARLVAVSLAYQAQPFGIDEKAQALGVVATTRDIYRVYATPGKVYNAFSNKSAAKRFWKAMLAGNYSKAVGIIQTHCPIFSNKQIKPFDGGAAHRQLRNNQGRISNSQSPAFIVQPDSSSSFSSATGALKIYVSTEINKVGFGKGGWAACARALGGTRGIPGWISRQNALGTVVENYGATVMSITMTNQVPYASSILSPAQKQEAVRIAMDKLRASIQIAIRGNGKAPQLNG